MTESNKQFLSDNYSLKEQAEAGTLNLTEKQKREFYRVLHEEVDANAVVNLYSQQSVNEMVCIVFYQYDSENFEHKYADKLQNKPTVVESVIEKPKQTTISEKILPAKKKKGK